MKHLTQLHPHIQKAFRNTAILESIIHSITNSDEPLSIAIRETPLDLRSTHKTSYVAYLGFKVDGIFNYWSQEPIPLNGGTLMQAAQDARFLVESIKEIPLSLEDIPIYDGTNL
jgi:hypothetical protein